MCTKNLLLALCIGCLLPLATHGEEQAGQGLYHAYELETGLRLNQEAEGLLEWDLDGWVGTDENKLRLKFNKTPNPTEKDEAEFAALFSHNISTFWDAQIGLRLNTQPDSLIYAVIGFEGLAPYFLETEAHLFISEEGDLSFAMKYEKDFLLTQKLIARPYIEAVCFAQTSADENIGSGLSNAELGIQTRFEFNRTIALYLDLKYDRKFGETRTLAINAGNDTNSMVTTLGFKFLF
jgi:copper resistance protein B